MFSSPAIFLCLPCSLSVHLSLSPLFFKLNVSFHGVVPESQESRAVDGFGGEDPAFLWAHHGTDRVKEGQRHTCTHANANTHSCSFQISFKEIEFDEEGVIAVPLTSLSRPDCNLFWPSTDYITRRDRLINM